MVFSSLPPGEKLQFYAFFPILHSHASQTVQPLPLFLVSPGFQPMDVSLALCMAR